MISSPTARLDLVIGIDGGATHTDALLADATTGAAIGRGTAGPSNIQAVGVDAASLSVGRLRRRAFLAPLSAPPVWAWPVST
jgi:N-acetylglucosamine kinase-like BadF-type ATPase